jgi:hypothetical protein
MPWPYSTGPSAARGEACIDAWLPDGAWKLEHHAIDMAVPPAEALAAIRDMRQGELPIVSALMALRGIPVGASQTLGEFFSTAPFVALEEEPGRELVGGIVGPFWHFGRGRLPAALPRTPEEFRDALAGGRIAAIANFRADPLPGGGSRLWTETWGFAPVRGEARLFTAYWLLIGPFSAWIRRMFLGGARRRAIAAKTANAGD